MQNIFKLKACFECELIVPTIVAEEDRGGVSRMASTWLHLKSTVTLLWDSIVVFSTTAEPNKVNRALPLINIWKHRRV